MADDKMTKHQELARTGHFDGFAKGGHAKKHPSTHGHGSHGHKHMHDHHPKHGSHGGSIHSVTSEHGESTSAWDTDSVGTDGGGKHPSGGGTGGTRNRI